MKLSDSFGFSSAKTPLSAVLLTAFMCHGVVAHGASDSYFNAPEWAEDDYGWYDKDLDWETNDLWYNKWNDTDLNAWRARSNERAHWDLLGYDDAGQEGAFDW